MTTTQALLAFVAAAAVLTITPGLDTAMVLRSAAAGGARRAIFAAVGIGLGCFVWGAVASVGLGALLAASEIGFTALKWAGAAYLLYSGIKLLLRPRQSFELAAADPRADAGWKALRQGFLTNILNPKVGVFYITFLPQFIPAGVSVVSFSLLLTGIQVVFGLAWFAMLIALTVPLGRMLRHPRAMKVLDRLTGGVFVVFGAKLALTR